MAEFVRATGSDLTPIEHELSLFHEQLKGMNLKGMLGKKGSGAAIITDTTLTANAGDTVRYHYVPHAFTGKDPIRGQDATILGNEETINESSFDVLVDEVNFALRKKGKMTDQRTVYSIGEEQERQIVTAFTQYSEDQVFKMWSGGALAETNASMISATGTADRVNGDGRCIQASGPNGSSEITEANSDNTAIVASVGVADTLSPRLIEDAVIMARTSGEFKMYPVRVGPNNEEYFCLFVSLKAARDLRSHPEWQNHALSAMERGLGGDMIAQGSLGIWDNVIVKASERVIEVTSGSNAVARNLLVGRDSLILGWAQTMDFTEEIIDHKRVLSSNGSEIRGEAKVTGAATDGGAATDMGIAQVLTISK